MTPIQFRESQRRIIEDYQGGLMGIAAVPGSGKTFTLSHLAARLVERVMADGQDDTEVLIVTFSNSAVNSFRRRIADILQQQRGLLPYVGYRVRTLHGLAHDIVRERPALVGLAEDFQILDDRISLAILNEVIQAHIVEWMPRLSVYLSSSLSEGQLNQVKVRNYPDLLADVATRFISMAKNLQATPIQLSDKLANGGPEFDLARFATAVYADYQRSLAFRGAVDFEDLIFLALQALRTDTDYLARLQTRWPYILEDEAQDSSALQEEMLGLLAGRQNWVRVGDPNQAINTTFTTADPRYLADFLARSDVQMRDLPTSGRSGEPIIALANELLRWTVEEHPAIPLRGSFYNQRIQPTTADDPQQNPLADETRVYIHYRPDQAITPDEELEIVIRSLRQWLPDNPDKTVALLVPENSRGFKLAERLKEEGLPYEELLRSTSTVRQAAAYLFYILNYLATPHELNNLIRLYRAMWHPLNRLDFEPEPVIRVMRGFTALEDLVFHEQAAEFFDEEMREPIARFFQFVRFALAALSLPIDQLILTVTQRLFTEPVDIALSYKVAVLMNSFAAQNPQWRLSDFAAELEAISQNQRRFLGFDDASEGYEPTPGLPTIATMHASKGLEWDRVYLLALSNYAFPSLQAGDSYVSEKWFLEPDINLEAEALEQLTALATDQGYTGGRVIDLARQAYAGERLRLLYVAITRARRELIGTWNQGKFAQRDNQPVVNTLALPVFHLLEWLK